ncbi:BTAD domain-containing putative transcriptional regulator [Crossiella sp. CA-258035]|uniref:BTAD domain-containing putative transcriptional regulator n=1 Tax=Crossiella sp. CA-258035 TaxID=2981138 RepID=UPI0024BC0734|nr:BTAD domain-containing putative transcriptional regulator [Crossiella sp. CA-258035]WHT19585.1 BTAD domain-containing putative transcriptional regulator [Crossiella sp. CA-258035]
MRFGVLGPLVVWTAEGTPVRVPEAKVRALLAVLLVHAGHPVSADRLVEDLWGERPPANPAAALQHKVWQLRKAIGAERVESRPPGYLLRVRPEEVDASRFLGCLERGDLAGALALWRGPVLADFPDAEFARGYADRLTESRLHAIEQLAAQRLAAGEPVLAELTPLVREYPLRERLRALHLRALYRDGRQAEALAGYAEFREQLAEELGADPSPELAEVHQAILRQDPELTRRATLPAPLTELIGRDAERAELGALLREARLVTLTGPGGVGKTSLALATAGRESFVDGSWLVELAGHGPEVEQAVSAALGVREDVPSADRLLDAVRGKRMLLVLDNCEHVLEPVAALARRLLRAAPELRILATSREALGLAGETQYVVRPLAAEHAVALFAARAPGFRLTQENTPTVAAICARLDGLPLAVELAATRVRVLGVDELAARLDDRFGLLTTGHRGAPPRQQTLRAMIDWSWELLTAAERLVLSRLAVHAEGCTLAAAEAVCAGAGVRPDEVLDLLSRLVDRSLVTGGPRYRLLESVAAYCLEKLAESGELAALRQRHRDYYLALAEQAAPELHGEGQRCWLDGLDREMPNLHRALTGAEAGQALRLADALAWYWFLRGRFTEAIRAFDQALATAGGDPALRARVRAWRAGFRSLAGEPLADLSTSDSRTTWLLGYAVLGKGDPAISQRLNDRALAEFVATGDRWGEAAALSTRAAQALLQGELTGMRRDAERSAQIFAELGDRWGQVQATSELAAVAEVTGDYPAAARLHREGLRSAEELGLWTAVTAKLAGLGRIALLTGELTESAELHRRAMAVAAQHGNLSGEQFAEVGLGLLARRQGRLDEAEEHLRRWVDWCREVDGGPGLALILTELGFIAEQRGDTAAALALHTESHQLAKEFGDPRAIALTEEGLAGAHAATDPELAATLLGRAAATRAALGVPLPPAERGDVDRIERIIRAASR